MRRKNSVQPEMGEAVFHYCARSFGGVSVAPEWHAKPVAQLGAAMIIVGMQANASAELVVAPTRDSEPEFVLFWCNGKELTSVPFFIRMWDPQRVLRHLPRSDQRHQFWNIRVSEATQNEPLGLNNRRIHHQLTTLLPMPFPPGRLPDRADCSIRNS